MASYHDIHTGYRFATVLLPLATLKPYTYSVPPEWQEEISFGKRVEVQFGRNKVYAGLVIDLPEEPPEGLRPKPILSVIDKEPILHPAQIKFWQWLATYYACTLGEVMAAALPAGLKLSSETLIVPSPFFEDHIGLLKGKEFLVAEALENREELSIEDIQKILGQKTVYPLIHSLLEKRLVFLKEELRKNYKPKKVACVRLQEPYRSQPELLEEAFDLLSRSTRQVEALMAYIQLSRKEGHVRKQEVYQKAQVDSSVLKSMEKKGVLELYDLEVSRMGSYEEDLVHAPDLSPQQERTLKEIRSCFEEKNVCLLHGVTGSGKTRIYMELIRECIERGEQALYLLPEIALTTQLVSRLQRIFGDDISVYHSRLNNSERVEVWQEVLNGKPLVMGARSGLFLPFKKLRLVIVDEEHDPSFKQFDPAPRYHARDSVIFLASRLGARVLLGTATPSLESYYNAKHGKYGLVEMPERYGGVDLPEMIIADKRKEAKDRKMQSHFSSLLIESMQQALENQEQIILFQNRRGYAPSINCTTCGWNQQCVNCDVTLTYHKHSQNMRCHYCGYQAAVPQECPACGNLSLHLFGFGTEKIEDELRIYLPEARISRMDFDTVRGKQAYAKLINDFEERRVDILVGTQMVTKGLDFDNVGVVGILSADHLLQFPDFRAGERAFQLMTQVAGRAGRKNKRGKVIIQAFNPDHPVIQEALAADFQRFYQREIMERQSFHYPPFNRLITVTLKHKKPDVLNRAMQYYHHLVSQNWKSYIIGPSLPPIPRIRTYYLLQIMIKLPANAKLLGPVKQDLLKAAMKTKGEEGCSSLRVSIDVDPY